MTSHLRQYLRQLRTKLTEPPSPRLADEREWYTEHTALIISTLKWALLGAVAGACVGLGTRGFLWTIAAAPSAVRWLTHDAFPAYWLLPLALPACVWLTRPRYPDDDE